MLPNTVRFGLVAGSTLALAALAAALAAAPARAAVVDVSTFKNLTYVQTMSGVTATGAFFNAGVDHNGGVTGVTLTYPGPDSPATLPMTSPTNFGIGPGFPSQGAMDTAYPMGQYVFSVVSGGSTTTYTLDYSADAYALNVGALTAASFAALQDLSTKQTSLTVDFNEQTPSSLATTAFTFFSVGNQSCQLSPSATSCTIDPALLKANTSYTYELDFSDRIETLAQDGALEGVDFDVRTDGVFTTAGVPEPSSWALAIAGIGILGLTLRRRRSTILAAVRS